jgi:hypothetical protein
MAGANKSLEKTNGRAEALTKRHPCRYDWPTIKEHFVESGLDVTLKHVSEVFGIPYATVRERAANERWTYLRATFHAELSRANKKQRIERLDKDAKSFDDSSLRVAAVGQVLVTGRLSQMADLFTAGQNQHNETVKKVRAGETPSRADLSSPLNYKELSELAKGLQGFQDVGRKALGTDAQNLNIQGETDVSVDHNVKVTAELAKDDQDRLAAMMLVMQRTGLAESGPGEGGGVLEAEVVAIEERPVALS